MYFSKYNIIIPIKKNIYILYNTYSNSYFITGDKFIKKYANIRDALDYIDIKTYQLMLNNRYIVNIKEDIYNLNYNEYKASIANSEIIYLTISPTLLCNLNCDYCFQRDRLKGKKNTLNNDEWQYIIHWINMAVDNNPNIKNMIIRIFGGEPLMFFNDIKENIGNLKHKIMNKVKINMMIYTNGILLNEKMASEFTKMGINQIQISVDEERMVDNKFTNNLFNACMYLEKYNINNYVRINYDKRIDKYINKIRYIENELKKYKTTISYLAPIFEPNKECSLNQESILLSETDLYKEYKISVFEKLGKNSLIDFPTRKRLSCYNESRYSLNIGPNLEIYQCHTLIGSDQSVGNLAQINSFEELITMREKIKELKIDSQCFNCKYYPICIGECSLRRKYKDKCIIDDKYISGLFNLIIDRSQNRTMINNEQKFEIKGALKYLGEIY